MQESDDVIWFASKVDLSILVILGVVPLIQTTLLVLASARGDTQGMTATGIGLGVVAAIYALLVIPVRYGVGDEALFVRFGVIRQTIRYRAVREVYPTHSPLSSPALSFDRLAIRTGRGPLHLTLISPVRRDEFMDLLTHRAELRWDGLHWVPKVEPTSV